MGEHNLTERAGPGNVMTREEGWALAQALADARFSCSLHIGVHGGMAPDEACQVSVKSLHFTAEDVRRLVTVGEEHEAELHLLPHPVFMKKAS